MMRRNSVFAKLKYVGNEEYIGLGKIYLTQEVKIGAKKFMQTQKNPISQLVVGIKSAGEMASGIAWCLYYSNIKKIFMMELENPLLVRREVSFGDSVYKDRKMIEGVTAKKVTGSNEVKKIWSAGYIAVAIDPDWGLIDKIKPDIIIDAIMAKKNLGTNKNDAELVIAVGPGFEAKKDADVVIESNRGHNLGRVISKGSAEPNTGNPGSINGYTLERVLRAPCRGAFQPKKGIGDHVNEGDIIGNIGNREIKAGISGVVRGLIAQNTTVKNNEKIGDIDPRGISEYCNTISEKARAIGGGVLEAILMNYNR